MTPQEYQKQLTAVHLLASCALTVPAGDMLNMIREAEAVGPIIDPTLWIAKAKAMDEDRSLIEAVQSFAETVRAMVEKKKVELRRVHD